MERLTRFRFDLRFWLKGLLVVTVPLAPLAGLALSIRALQSEQLRAAEKLRQSVQIRSELQTLQTSLQGAQAGVSLYLLRGREEFLEPYRTARASMAARLRTLDALLGGDSIQYQRLERLQPLVERHLDILAGLRKYSVSAGASPAAPPESPIADSRAVLSRIQAVLGEIQRAEDLQFGRASEQARQAQRRADRVLVAAVVFGALGGIAAFWLVMHFVVGSERRRTEEAFQDSQRQLRDMLKGAENQVQELASSESVLRYRARLLQSVLDSMSDGVVLAGADGGPVLSNDAAGRILDGVSQANSATWVARYGLCLPDGKTPCPPAELPVTRALRGENVDNAVLFASRAHSTRGVWVNVTARPLVDEAGQAKGAVAVFTDITPHKNSEAKLARQQEEAERTSRAKSEFLSRMSLELRTPLNAILGFAQLLDTARLKSTHRDIVVQIARAGRHLLALMDDVLDLARIESGRMALCFEPVSAADLLSEAQTVVQSQAAERKVRIEWTDEARANLFVRADRQRLAQILASLLSTAIRHSYTGGTVSLSCQKTDPRRVRIKISESGVGPQESPEPGFRPYERLSPGGIEVEGDGIGVALSKRLAEVMAGKAGVENQADTSRAYWVELPMAATPLITQAQPSAKDLAAVASAVLDAQIAALLGIPEKR